MVVVCDGIAAFLKVISLLKYSTMEKTDRQTYYNGQVDVIRNKCSNKGDTSCHVMSYGMIPIGLVKKCSILEMFSTMLSNKYFVYY